MDSKPLFFICEDNSFGREKLAFFCDTLLPFGKILFKIFPLESM